MRVPTFPTDIVGNFIGEYIAPDVLLNNSVSGVGSLTRLPNVNNQTSLQDKGKNLMFPTAGALPTPVLVEKLAFYLEGYDAKISQELVAGFFMVFVYIFKEGSIANFLLTCNQHCKTQELLTVNWLRKFVRGAFGALLFNLHSIT